MNVPYLLKKIYYLFLLMIMHVIHCIAFLFFPPTCKQEQVSGSATTTVLRNLDPNTVYKVTLLPIYEKDAEGKRQSENGKTSRLYWDYISDFQWQFWVVLVCITLAHVVLCFVQSLWVQ